MKKSNNGFPRRWIGELKSRQNKTINVLQFFWKPLKSNFQKLFLIGGEMFNYF